MSQTSRTNYYTNIQQIKSSLGIPGVASRQSAWSKRGDDIEGAQIDLLIDRNDNIINMCEGILCYEQHCLIQEACHVLLPDPARP